ncbi:MAG: amidophosphoribosyltransferase [Phycisphaeraceae bacterium]|nr:amidophosphoribosyltransferase [Phycisphaerales bacterium]MCB9860833.1 amidophosphoribosyltransferase [Phycisphaeraceae bacterium]
MPHTSASAGPSEAHSLALPVLQSAPTRGCDDIHKINEKKEKCGVFAIWGSKDAVRLTYTSLYALQHRGQESAGIATSDGQSLKAHAGMGLVPEVFNHDAIERLERRNPAAAIGHVRYSTTGNSVLANCQPMVQRLAGTEVAIAHNGNLINGIAWRHKFEQKGHIFTTESDTESIFHLLAAPEAQDSPDPTAWALRRCEGAFSLAMLWPDRIEVARDPWGWRPLVLGLLPSGRHVVSSETVAFDVIGAKLVREIEPGEIVTLSAKGISSRRFADPAKRLAQCVFEHVYFANPASNLFGQNVQLAREAMGAALAHEAPVEADCVMPMPDSGRSAAHGYAQASGLPYREGIVPNRYVGRTFIKPTQAERTTAVRLKLNIIPEVVAGKRLIVVDDSVVRGTTTRVKMDQLRAAGAKEIHLRISCPPIRHPCFFGVDFASREQLIANDRTVEEIREFLGIDSLHYLSLDGLLGVMQRAPESYCTACYTGDYRLDVEHPVTDEFAEQKQLRMFAHSTSQATADA